MRKTQCARGIYGGGRQLPRSGITDNSHIIKFEDEVINDLQIENTNKQLVEDTTKQDDQSNNLKEIIVSEWQRIERPRKTEKRIDVYYYSPGDNS